MTLSTPATSTAAPMLHPTTRLGHVHYTTANLDKQIKFYQDILGFQVHWHKNNSAALGAGAEDLLVLTENRDARPSRGTTGLYHTAFLVPTRWELASLLYRIAETRTPIQGMSNHGTHLAIYLPDAEDNGIELAWDFPQAQWPKTIEEMLGNNRALYPQELVSALRDNPAPWEKLSVGTKVGHVHLHVSQLPPTYHFYHEVLGFDIPFEFPGESAIFFSAGGYHHHLGTNVWQGVGAPPPPADATGLRYYTVVLADATELNTVMDRVHADKISTEAVENGFIIRDPAQNGVLLTTEIAL